MKLIGKKCKGANEFLDEINDSGFRRWCICKYFSRYSEDWDFIVQDGFVVNFGLDA